MHRIIIIDDDVDYRQLVSTFLKSVFTDTEIEQYDPIANGIPDTNLDWSRFDCAIVDYYLCISNFTGLDLLKRQQTNPQFPASIMLTGAGNEEVMAKALKFGANRYISKQGLTKTVLKDSIEQAWQKHQDDLRMRKLIERRNRAFNKSRYYRTLENSNTVDFSNKIRAIVTIQVIDPDSSRKGQADLITLNRVLKHLALICFKYVSIRHPDVCITAVTDNSLGLILDYDADKESVRKEIEILRAQLQSQLNDNKKNSAQYFSVVTALLLDQPGFQVEQVSRQIKQLGEMACQQPRRSEVLFESIRIISEDEPGDQKQAGSSAIEDAETNHKPPTVKPAMELPADVSETEATEPETISTATAKQKEPEVAATEPEDKDNNDAVTPEKSVKNTAKPARKDKPVITAEKVEQVSLTQFREAPADDPADKIITTPEPATSPSQASDPYQIKIDTASLTDQEKEIVNALDESRIDQLFQPVMIFNNEHFSAEEIYHLSLQVIQKDGDEESARQLFSTQQSPTVGQYIDRWMIKEALGKDTDLETDTSRYMFIIKLSVHSLVDTSLFNWLRELLSKSAREKPGSSIVLEISIRDFLENKKQVSALIGFLSRNHGFNFAFGHIDSAEQVKAVLELPGNKLLMLNKEVMQSLKAVVVEDEDSNFIHQMKTRHTYMIARDIDDSTMLMNAVSEGADFAMGKFVGEPQAALDESSNIESYDLENRLGSTIF